MKIETNRLILRQWINSDYDAFAKMCTDEKVMEHFPSTLSKQESYAAIDRCIKYINENGWGFWALEEKFSGNFIGFTGLNSPSYQLPFSPCIEIGWRLAYSAWGNGFATEAATACLNFGFEHLGVNHIVAFTTLNNIRSQNVMRRIGMQRRILEDFDHPNVKDIAFKRHCLFEITSDAFKK